MDGTGKWGYMSGQLGICPNLEPAFTKKSQKLISTKAGPQAERALKNMRAVAHNNGFTLNDCVKTLVFLTDMSDFAAVNEAYAEFFPGDDVPARSCVTVM